MVEPRARAAATRMRVAPTPHTPSSSWTGENAGHMLALEEPEAVIAAMQEFIAASS